MPVIDTMVLFAAANTRERWHIIGKKVLTLVNMDKNWWVPSYSLLEFDLVLKSREYTPEERMEKYSLLLHDFPNINEASYPITPLIFHEVSRLENVYDLDYFDAGVVATSLALDGKVVTKDTQIQKIGEVESVWEEINKERLSRQ
ncbi:MAG: type II toxin-antitoxin system VapC family toxin [Candidatus Hodarchaeales archaeon]|jgi:predicted nucleic acid-binding protein